MKRRWRPRCDACGATLGSTPSMGPSRCGACLRAIGKAPLLRERAGAYRRTRSAVKASTPPSAHQAELDRRMRRGNPYRLRSRSVTRFRRF